jgi:uncharacterized membrane protein
MLIVAMTWAYIVMMMAATAKSAVIGVLLFIVLAIIPLGLALWLTVRRRRAQISAKQDALAVAAFNANAADAAAPPPALHPDQSK